MKAEASRTVGQRNRSKKQPVVIGVADHNGWAVLVSTAAVNGEPTVVDRRRVELIEKGVPSQPYHHETLTLTDTEAEQLVRKVKRSILACTTLALEQLSTDLTPQYRVCSIAIRQPPLPHLPATVREAHRSYFVFCRADGMLYHSAICKAAGERDWTVAFHRRGEELVRAAEALHASTNAFDGFMKTLGRTLGPPWTMEHRNAFAAAIGLLRNESRLRGLR